MTEAERDFIGEAWLRNGLAEHASVASFARFMLLAMKVGAPPHLLAATAEAMKDEIRHAKLCFSVASLFLGRPVGPGPFDIDSPDEEEQGPAAILAATIAEGCVAETVAAAVVRQAHDHAEDPEIRRILASIAEDERRHADLAWDFVRWLLTKEPALTAAAHGAFAAALVPAVRPETGEEPPPIAEAYGVVAPLARRAVRDRTVAAYVIPRAAELLRVPESRVLEGR